MFGLFKKKKSVEDEKQEVTKEEFTDVMPIAQYFKNETGVTFDKQMSILKNKVITFCRQRDIFSFIKLMELIDQDKGLKQELIDYLTTNETFFYREFNQIEELVSLVKQANNKVDILCAPCATGEEPYSIAIALLEAGVSPGNFHITGIDINNDALRKAEKAVYRERNIRNLSSTVVKKYFTEEENKYTLNNSVKLNVTFKLINLFDASFKQIGKFDYIFSRNMLIYFDKETKLKARTILESIRKNNNQKIFFGHADLF